MVYDLPCGDLDFHFRFGMQIVDDEDATSDQDIGPDHVGGREADEHPCALCFPQPFVSRTITNTSKQPHEKQIESVAVSVIDGPADYLRHVTAELLHPDIVSHRQLSVHTRRQGHVCSLNRLITPP